MRKTVLRAASVVLFGLGVAAQAALPPKYQRERELGEVLKAAVSQLDDPVDQIARVGEDRYRVLAGRCVVIARIVSMPMAPMMSGPRKFRVSLGRPACR